MTFFENCISYPYNGLVYPYADLYGAYSYAGYDEVYPYNRYYAFF